MKTNNPHWIYLEELRRSGNTNMFGSVPQLMEKFQLSHPDAVAVLADWMKNYNPDDYGEE